MSKRISYKQIKEPCVIKINYQPLTENKLESKTYNKLESKTDNKRELEWKETSKQEQLYQVEWIREGKKLDHIIYSLTNLTAEQVRLLSIYTPGQILLIANKTIDTSIRPCVKIDTE